MKPGVDILVVNYQTPEDLQGFLDSVHVQIEHDLWIANVSPTPMDTAVMTDYAQHHSAFQFDWSDNVGYAGAVNYMAYPGDREVIAIFNADVVLSPGSVEACWQALMENDDWAVLGPLQLSQRGRVTHAGIFGTNTDPKHRGWFATQHSEYRDVKEAISVSGSAYFIKRKVWEQLADCDARVLGGPKPPGAFLSTPLYFEETWCSYHARAHGYKVMYYGPVVMTHKYHQAVEHNETWAKKQWRISQQMFRDACAKHGIECD